MAFISYKRLRCTTLVTTQVGGRVFNYDGVTPTVDGNTQVLTIAQAKAKATWDTATDSPFRVGDLILVSCTDGTQYINVDSITNGVPTVNWITETPAV